MLNGGLSIAASRQKAEQKKSWLIDNNNNKVLTDSGQRLVNYYSFPRFAWLTIVYYHCLLSFNMRYIEWFCSSIKSQQKKQVFLFVTQGNCVGLDCFRLCTGLAWLSQHVLGSCLEGNVMCVFTGPIKTCSSQSTLYDLMQFSFNIKGGIGYD